MRSPTVLVVDDDPDLRTIRQTVLGSEGYQVSTATDGECALRHTEPGLTAGADDYLTKPFHLGELLAHVQALLPSDPAEERPNEGGG